MIFSINLFLIGDSNALSNWEIKDNPPLALLMVLFSIITAVYLMNLLIGLLSNAIEKDNNRISYLMQKAKVFIKYNIYIYITFFLIMYNNNYFFLKNRFWQKLSYFI